MKNYFVKFAFICIGLIMSNCTDRKDPKENCELKYLNGNFKLTIDTFIDKTNDEPEYKYDEILVKIYKNKLDTLMLIDNSPVTEKKDFVFSGDYNGYKIYFFSPEEFRNKLYKLVDTSSVNKDLSHVKVQNIDISYQLLYKFQNDTIVRQHVPIDVQ